MLPNLTGLGMRSKMDSIKLFTMCTISNFIRWRGGNGCPVPMDVLYRWVSCTTLQMIPEPQIIPRKGKECRGQWNFVESGIDVMINEMSWTVKCCRECNGLVSGLSCGVEWIAGCRGQWNVSSCKHLLLISCVEFSSLPD